MCLFPLTSMGIIGSVPKLFILGAFKYWLCPTKSEVFLRSNEPWIAFAPCIRKTHSLALSRQGHSLSTHCWNLQINRVMSWTPTRGSIVGTEGRISCMNLQNFKKKALDLPYMEIETFLVHLNPAEWFSGQGRGIIIQSSLTFDSQQKVLTKLDEFCVVMLAVYRITPY